MTGVRADPAPIIQSRDLTKAYGSTRVLEGVDLDVSRGITGLLGSNGSGKTTLIGLILGLHAADSGQLTVLGHDPRSAGPSVRRRIGYSPEHHDLPPDVQAMDLVRHVAELHGVPHRPATERASDALWQVGLGEERFRPIGTMSTGQRQRVKLAMAIGHDPDVLVLDEPTDGLDPVQRDDMLDLIGRIGQQYGMDVLLSSHLLDEVERVCTHVVILGEGRVQRSAALDEPGDVAGRVIVELLGDAEGVVAHLRAAGLAVQTEGRTLIINSPSGEPVNDAVRDAVVAAGVGLYRLEQQRASLTDVYLELG